MNITDRAALEGILRAAPILYLALHADPAPYIVPDTLFVHGATAGTKIDLIRANPFVGFSACTDVAIRAGLPAAVPVPHLRDRHPHRRDAGQAHGGGARNIAGEPIRKQGQT